MSDIVFCAADIVAYVETSILVSVIDVTMKNTSIFIVEHCIFIGIDAIYILFLCLTPRIVTTQSLRHGSTHIAATPFCSAWQTQIYHVRMILVGTQSAFVVIPFCGHYSIYKWRGE